MKKLYLFLLFPLTILGQTQMGSSIFPELQNEQAGWYVSMSSDGHTVAVGAQPKDENNNYFARARVYSFDGQDWVQKGQTLRLLNYSGNYSAKCRVSLSADGNTLAISSPNQGTLFNGIVMIYRYEDSNWELLGNYFIGGQNNLFGYGLSLSADGNIFAITSPGPNAFNEFGYIAVYQFDGAWWNQLGQKIEGYDNETGYYSLDQSVVVLSNDGTVMAIGTPFGQGNGTSGEVRIYKYVAGIWEQKGGSIVSDEGLNFGWSVSISGDGNILAAGKIGDNGRSYVRVFEFNTDQWIQKGEKIYGDESGDFFGGSVSISDDGTVLAVGAPHSNVVSSYQKGFVRIFKFRDNNWSQVGSDINGSASNNLFGYDLALSSTGNLLAIASPYKTNHPYYESGNVNVYDLSNVLSTNTIETESFSLYPNPAQDLLNIVLENNFYLVEVKIYNSIGQLIKTGKTDFMDISELASGTYYVQIITPQLSATKMLIKN